MSRSREPVVTVEASRQASDHAAGRRGAVDLAHDSGQRFSVADQGLSIREPARRGHGGDGARYPFSIIALLGVALSYDRVGRTDHAADASFRPNKPRVGDDVGDSRSGIRYARNQRVGLSQFLEDGRLPIHNNMSELELRREAVGRKNWLFVGSDDAGAVNALFTSLLASCQLFAIEPWSYLRDLFSLLPQWPEHSLLELAPLNWNKTKARDEVRALLDANLFRKLTLETGRLTTDVPRGKRLA